MELPWFFPPSARICLLFSIANKELEKYLYMLIRPSTISNEKNAFHNRRLSNVGQFAELKRSEIEFQLEFQPELDDHLKIIDKYFSLLMEQSFELNPIQNEVFDNCARKKNIQ